MNPYEKLDHETRAWDVAETAAFLGYSIKHVYKLIHEGKIEGWMKIEGGDYKFCPAKLKVWMEKRFNGNGGPPKPMGNSNESPERNNDDEAA